MNDYLFALMLCPADSYRGEWMLKEIIAGGNFGHYAASKKQGLVKRVWADRKQHLKLLRFYFSEALWVEIDFWKTVIATIPTRIKYRSLSLGAVKKHGH